MDELNVPVLVVGGGGCGLSASIFLSNLGVEHLVVERHTATSNLPKAHYINQRTMEVFRQHGVADAIYDVAAPIENFGKVRWLTSLGGHGELDQRLIHSMDAFGGGALRSRYEKDSPVMSANYPQIRLEPLLRDQAEQRNPGKILFHHEVTAWQQHDDGGVTVTVKDRDHERELTMRARYVIAADGGKTFGQALGAVLEGPTSMVDMVSTHFSADLSDYWDDESLITWFLNPEGASSWGAGAMVQMGPTWGRKSEEWVVHFAFRPDDPERFNEEAIVPRLRELLRLPDLDLKVHKVSHWILDRIVATQWRFGDIFLAGDAAHRQPPTTGLGLNTGIQDAHNLAWKLALVVNGQADDRLLDTYESERLPVSADGADWALLAFMNHTVIDAGIGLIPGAPVEANVMAFQTLFSDTRLGRAHRHRAEVTIDTQSWEFQAHDVEIGFNYETGALVPDGTPVPERDATGRQYQPTTRPGHRLPHAWLTTGQGRVSTHDLVGPSGRFLLLAADDSWTAAAEQAAAKANVELSVVVIGDTATPVDEQWQQSGGPTGSGALIVRPDNVVAFRAAEVPADAVDVLVEAFGSLLRR